MAQEKNRTEANSQGQSGLDDAFFEKATGRDRYFKPVTNKKHALVLRAWKPVELMGNVGLQFDVTKVDGEEFPPDTKLWTVTSKRSVRELEPILKAAIKSKKDFLNIEFEKILSRGEKDTDAKFRARNLDPAIDEYLEQDQRSAEIIGG